MMKTYTEIIHLKIYTIRKVSILDETDMFTGGQFTSIFLDITFKR